MKLNIKVADYKADRLVIVKDTNGGKRKALDNRKIVVRLFDDETINRLVEAGEQQPLAKPSR